MKHFESFLAPQLNEFIAYRKNLGYSIKTVRIHLLCFDRYVKDKNIKPGVLAPSVFLEFRGTLKMEPKTINGILSIVRIFFNFLVRTDYYPSNPLNDIPSLPERSFAPFIFSPEQTDQLIKATCKRIRKQSKYYYLKDLSGYMAIVLLARCGLRIQEPLQLQIHHYRNREKTIYIEKTKFNKDRLIPVPKSVAAELDNFLTVRTALMDEVRHTYLLVGNRERKLNDPRVRSVFHQAVHDIGIDCPRQVIGQKIFASPTPHSLRHSCAVNMLLSGKSLTDIQNRLGHENIQSTIAYTHMDLTRKQAVQKRLIEHMKADLSLDPKISEWLGWENKKNILDWLDSL